MIMPKNTLTSSFYFSIFVLMMLYNAPNTATGALSAGQALHL